MNAAPRRLVVMRHAQAATVASADRDRPLTEQGVRDATAAGEWLAQQRVAPDHAVVSPALRTWQTWDALATSGGWQVAPDLEPALYQAGAETVLDLVRLVPPEASQVLVLGHNPTVSHVATLLSDGSGDRAAAMTMARGHPPAALALFDVHEEWAQLAWGDGHLCAFVVPRG